MLNGFNAHANAANVKKIGANRKELHGAVAIEMQPVPAERDLQIEANRKLATASKGLISLPDGTELYLTLGTGHMASFCRSANAGGTTPFKTLQGPDGKTISTELLKRDPEWKAMLEEGWLFDILPWQVEKSWPSLPEFIQRALNAANSVATDATEWEVAIAMSETFESMAEAPSWQLAMQAATAGNPRCAPYAASIRSLVQLYGGGSGAPIIREQDAFAKTLGAPWRGVHLGEEFTRAVVETKLHAYEPRLHLRHALISANLSSPKVVNGVAKLITKSDIFALQNQMVMVGVVDDELGAAREFLLSLKLPWNQQVELLGLLRVRMGAHVCRKGRYTFERKAYSAREEILALFVTSVLEALQALNLEPPVSVPKELSSALQWANNAADAASSGSPAPSQQHCAAPIAAFSIEEISGILRRRGFEVDGLVYESSAGKKEGIYKILQIDHNVFLQVYNPMESKPQLIVAIPFAKFIKGWVPFKGEMTMHVGGDWTSRYVGVPANSLLDRHRCTLYLKLHELAQSYSNPYDLVQLCIKPMSLRAKADIKKGELTLVPTVTNLACITKHMYLPAEQNPAALNSQTVLVHMTDDITLTIAKAAQPNKHASVEEWGANDTVNPYWWVGVTSDSKDANMSYKPAPGVNIIFSIMTNNKLIKAGQELCIFREAPPALKRKLVDAIKVAEKRSTKTKK